MKYRLNRQSVVSVNCLLIREVPGCPLSDISGETMTLEDTKLCLVLLIFTCGSFFFFHSRQSVVSFPPTNLLAAEL